jgi:hypothetical protein
LAAAVRVLIRSPAAAWEKIWRNLCGEAQKKFSPAPVSAGFRVNLSKDAFNSGSMEDELPRGA